MLKRPYLERLKTCRCIFSTMPETHGDTIGFLDAQLAQGPCQCITQIIELFVRQLIGRRFDSSFVRRSFHHSGEAIKDCPFDERSLIEKIEFSRQ